MFYVMVLYFYRRYTLNEFPKAFNSMVDIEPEV